jgi:phospholipid/cholesterol/gamma-HCH transport system substrate-binding protein
MAKLKPESRTLVRSFQVGVGGIIFIAFLMWITVEAQFGNPLADKTYVKAAFKDIDTLAIKDPVRQNSKGIGRVIDIQYGDGEAIVTLQIELGDGYRAYKNATASIQDQSAVGSKFVELRPGTPDSGELGDGVIPQAQTKSSRDVYQILDLFDPATRAGANGFLTQFGGGLTGQATNFKDFMANGPDTLSDTGTVAAALGSKEADLPALLNAADRVSSRFAGRQDQLASLIEQTESTFSGIVVDDGRALSETLNRAPATLDALKRATDSINPSLADTRAAMTDFEAGARSLGDSEDDLRGVLTDGIPALDDVPDVADKVTPAFKDLTPALKDTRPLAPRAADALRMASTPLKVLAPYSKELGYLFVRGRSFLSEGTADGVHYARLNADVQGPASFTGGFVKYCNFAVNAYPKPGEADKDHTTLGLGGNQPCGLAAKGLPGSPSLPIPGSAPLSKALNGAIPR